MSSKRKIAISDIHGCVQTFKTLLEDKVYLDTSDELYLLGDYIDRGPDSKGVIDYILQLKARGFTVHCLKGNHEDMMLASLHNFKIRESWEINGGITTLQSFGSEELHKVPQRYWDFLNDLEYYRETDGFLLVHAGLNFNAIDPLIDVQSMMWIRGWENEIDSDWLRNRVIVHGHTPVEMDRIRNSLKYTIGVQVIDIDAGCYALHRPGMGNLCAFDMTNKQLYFCPNLDMRWS